MQNNPYIRSIVSAVIITMILILLAVSIQRIREYIQNSSQPDQSTETAVSSADEVIRINTTPEVTQEPYVKEKTYLRLEETSSPVLSDSEVWWVNSGGYVDIKNGVILTIQGNIDESSKWYDEYNNSNPEDTDNGKHPQNILRLVRLKKWTDVSQQMYFKINRYNNSSSPNRNESNGVLLFNRYQDGNNLYYAGIRVDGNIVIKKKYKGDYYTMAIKKVLDGEYIRDPANNLLPLNKRMGIRSTIENKDNSVVITLYTDLENDGNWTLELQSTDTNGQFGGNVISDGGNAGIRSDFMDVEFIDYQIDPL